ncbi:hypothetical protein Dip518_001228 [Parelusimicrobium proximum]|uniref:hypothetical protein n=1 Tax=Parelusimicrobium proximum TaxID=3228953 RepID=UPI003D170AC0
MTDKESTTGKYIYDPKLKKVVKVSSDIPKKKSSEPHSCGAGCGCHGCPHNG